MNAEASLYIPYAFRSFQGFRVLDIKESQAAKTMEICLQAEEGKTHLCSRCGGRMGAQKDRYWVTARHLRVFDWQVTVSFWREKRWCPHCKKTRSEWIEWLCPTSPHVTMELSWWINRLSEVTSVLQASHLESVDKMTCYKADKYILQRLLQGYAIPKVTHIAVDEVYARSRKQLKPGEKRDDLFFTVIVDIRTHKVIWVSASRRAEALEQFFEILGPDACKDIKVVATDQHDGYTQATEKYCPQAVVVLDRFHLVKNFNEALNEDRKDELAKIDPEGEMGDLMNGKYRYVFLTKAANRTGRDQKHIATVMRLNQKIAKLEIIKEHFHKIFDAPTKLDAQVMLAEIYQWSLDAKATNVFNWVLSVLKDYRFWNYFEHRYTSGVIEGINRAIKGLKWQAYGYKDMAYFMLKIMQKVGYLNHRNYLKAINTGTPS